MTDQKAQATERAQRIAKARANLAAAYAADPAGVARYEARRAHLAASAKRERDRFETLVLGRTPQVTLPKRPAGMSRAEWTVERKRLREEATRDVSIAERWKGKQGTPETLDKHARRHEGALAQLATNGTITPDQLAWAHEIAVAAESIERDVEVRTASLETRVDTQRHGTTVEQRLGTVRLHMAYTHWRKQLPQPKRLVLDMIAGEAIGYSVAATRHRVHKRRAKRELIAALDRWPACRAWARTAVAQDDVDQINAELV